MRRRILQLAGANAEFALVEADNGDRSIWLWTHSGWVDTKRPGIPDAPDPAPPPAPVKPVPVVPEPRNVPRGTSPKKGGI